MPEVFVTVKLDTDAWTDVDDDMPISISFSKGLGVSSVAYLLDAARKGIQSPDMWTSANNYESHEIDLGE